MHQHNTRSQGQPVFQLNLEIGRTVRKSKRNQQQAKMADENQNPQRLFGDFYEPKFDNTHVVREITAENYTVPPTLIGLIQNGAVFQGLENEDPNAHVKAFLNLSNTCKLAGISQDELRRILFPFSLRGQALSWYDAVKGSLIESFEELIKKFTIKYFPPAKMDRLRNEIHQFKQHEHESFSESWERFQELLRKSPNKLVEEEYELQLFYKGLTQESRNIVNASAGGSLKDKTYAAVKELLQKIADNGNAGHSERTLPTKKQACVLQPDNVTELGAQVAAVMNKMTMMEAKLEGRSTISCGLCQGNHHTDQCAQLTESVNFVKDQGRIPYQQNWSQQQRPQGPYQGNASWNQQRSWQEPEASRSWNQQGTSNPNRPQPPGFVNSAPMPQEKGNFEEVVCKKLEMILSTTQRHDKQFEEQNKRTTLLETSVRNIEVQMGQLAQEIRRRPVGGLPSDTEINPKGKEVKEVD